MGKSMLLAYALFVLSTNKEILSDATNPLATFRLIDWNGLKPNIDHENRIICATAKREKQVRV